jgi:hypothetical protein
VITDVGIGMCGEIVKEHVAGLLGMIDWRGLTVGDFVEPNNNSEITAPWRIKDDTRDLLDTLDTKVVEERREIRVGQFNFLAIHRGSPAMRDAICRLQRIKGNILLRFEPLTSE